MLVSFGWTKKQHIQIYFIASFNNVHFQWEEKTLHYIEKGNNNILKN